MKKQLNLILFLFILITLLSLTKIAISNSITTNGITLNSMQQEIVSLNTQNYIIRQKYLQQASLLTIEQKAKAEGFTPNQTDYFVSETQHLASNQ